MHCIALHCWCPLRRSPVALPHAQDYINGKLLYCHAPPHLSNDPQAVERFVAATNASALAGSSVLNETAFPDKLRGFADEDDESNAHAHISESADADLAPTAAMHHLQKKSLVLPTENGSYVFCIRHP